ncbi:hypothetical protein OG875_11985 [Streptomyces sp. NBC_01498]|uniref:hypothetical protein n=1 Tax=Streptomyces sp. NBC_01498 TaxID=2975870 RepID=UPI002E7C45BC|nr:hypothetical protein [Streptomyces sp. NBC_01498]WTL25249.1 hypothetical protein OG875_11985 [Streptomyces sp. NBC_01498]
MRTGLRPLLALLLVLLGVLAAALALRGRGPEPGYEDGYTFGRDKGPAGHLGGADASDTGAAESECGEHGESDGIRVNDRWTAGCVDGALRLPKNPPPAP